MVYTADNILSAVKRNQNIVTNNFRFTDDDLLEFINDEIRNTVTPLLLSLQSERLTYTQHITLTNSVSAYDIPYRAVGGQLREAFWVDSSTSPTQIINLKWYTLEDGLRVLSTGQPTGIYFSGDQINVVPKTPTTASGYLKLVYAIRHSNVVLTEDTTLISSVDYNTGVVTTQSTIPTTFTSNLYYDFTLANDRSKPRILTIDKVASAATGTSITFTAADIPTGLVSGDRISLANQTSVLCLPDECYKYLCKAVELKIVEAQKDIEAVNIINNELQAILRKMEMILTPRIVGEARPILNSSILTNRRLGRKTIPDITGS
jgi:hypothetical protein